MHLQPLNKLVFTFLIFLLAACSAGDGDGREVAPASTEKLGLFTSLPIYWSDGEDIATMLQDGAQEPSWVREVLESQSELIPLDTLEADALAGLDRIVLAQPRALAPSENVALDSWLRDGGQALIFADPFLTQHSEFGLGDPRRPFDVVLISPILARWGLELQFDDTQPRDERFVPAGRGDLPVELAGQFAVLDGEAEASCTLSAQNLIADCKIGDGSAVLIADAAVLDPDKDSVERRAALQSLLSRLQHR